MTPRRAQTPSCLGQRRCDLCYRWALSPFRPGGSHDSLHRATRVHHASRRRNAVKIAWQSRRFWEADEHIYGGISWTTGPTTLVWYPSDRFFSPKGILLGAYAIGGQADELASRPLPEQFDMSRAAVEGLHPGRSRELEKPMAVAWSKMPYSLGFAARFRNGQESEVLSPQYAGRPLLLRR